jgi:hypothetical protein
MNQPIDPRRALPARLLIVATLGAALFAIGGWIVRDNGAYDVEQTKNKFRTIYRALELYREAYPPKPASEWRTYSDAGLPPYLLWLATVQGQPWSIPNGSIENFRVSNPVFLSIDSPRRMHLGDTYRAGDAAAQAEIDAILRARGMEFPFLIDRNVTRESDWKDHTVREVQAIVMRLNGRIDIIRYDRTKPNDELTK